MLRSFGTPDLAQPDSCPIVTIGMFDGVHIGHQEVLSRTKTLAAEHAALAIVITFDIHPRAVLAEHTPPPMITSLDHRLLLFERAGIDHSIVLPFDDKLANTSAEAFVQSILIDKLHAGGVVLGSDAHFGSNRSGNIALLEQFVGNSFSFAEVVPPVNIEGNTVSSTAIRIAVQAGDLLLAEKMLGRRVSVLGSVVSGQGLGRQLGFPTLNSDPHHELHPPRGVYITRTRCGNTTWNSITNIGHRPTVDARAKQDVLIETHLLDYSGDLYGQTIEVFFQSKLREEKKFGSLESLTRQVQDDIRTAQRFFDSDSA